jgi:hypothetical protein
MLNNDLANLLVIRHEHGVCRDHQPGNGRLRKVYNFRLDFTFSRHVRDLDRLRERLRRLFSV